MSRAPLNPRVKTWLWRTVWLASAAVLLMAALLSWLLYSQSGLAFALSTALASADGKIEYGALRGSLAGGFEIDEPQIELAGLRINARHLKLRPRLSALWHGELRIEAIAVDGARHTVLPIDTPVAAATARPGHIDLPIDIVLLGIELKANEINLGGEQPVVFSVGASEIALRSGKLKIAGLTLSQGELAMRASASVDTAADWSGEFATEGEWTLPEVLHRGQLRLQGDLNALNMEMALEGGGQVNLEANFARPLDAPGFEGQLGAVQLDLASFGIASPIRMLDLDLRFVWSEGKLGISGPVSIDGRALDLALVGLDLAPQQLRFERFDVSSKEVGSISVTGHWPTDPSAEAGALTATLKNLWAGDWRATVPPVPPRITGELTILGRSDDWQAALAGEWQYGEPRGPLNLAASGTPTRIVIAPSTLGLAQSLLEFAGTVSLTEPSSLALDVKAKSLDPGLLDPAWPGNLDASVHIDAKLAEASWEVAIAQLSGQLRAAPLALQGVLAGRDARPEAGKLDLSWGAGKVAILIGAEQAFSADLTQLDLALLGPLQGKVSGQLATKLDGEPIESTTASLQIDQFVAETLSAKQLRVDKRGGWDFDLLADELQMSGAQFRQFAINVTGAQNQHRAQIKADEARGHIELAVSGGWNPDNSTWTGSIDAIDLQPLRGASWSLVDTAALQVSANNLSLAQTCLQAANARACVGLSRAPDATTLRLDIDGLPLADIQAWAPASDFAVRGVLRGGGELKLSAAAAPAGTLNFHIEEGLLSGSTEYDAPLAFTGELGFDGASGTLSAKLNLPGHGDITGQAVRFSEADGQITAQLALTDLSFVDGLSAEIQGMRGAINGELSAPIADPKKLVGNIQASDLRFELPAAGLKASAGIINLTLAGDGLVSIDGSLDIAPGKLQFDGQLGLSDSDLSELHIRGDNAGLVDLPAVRLIGDTNFIVKRGPDGFAIEGGVLLRSGKIDLDRFTPAFPASADVVIEDAPIAEASLPITANISVALLSAVDLRGFGIEATLNGGVRVTQRPGGTPRASGEMLIKGIYNAYGQKLDIERGRLGFSGRAENPSLDILAVKRVDRQRVGVQVRGYAQRPVIRLYSDPALDQSETLSYLVLGRPLATASGADSEQLGEYASALETAGGSLVAGSIGKKLGLAAGVESFGSAIGSALVVGKYLSPRFFVGYGTSLLDATQLVILRFQFSEHIDIEGISGTEQKISVSWRTER